MILIDIVTFHIGKVTFNLVQIFITLCFILLNGSGIITSDKNIETLILMTTVRTKVIFGLAQSLT